MVQVAENNWMEQQQQHVLRAAHASVTACAVLSPLASVSETCVVLFEIARGQKAAAIPKAWLTGGYNERGGCNEKEPPD